MGELVALGGSRTGDVPRVLRSRPRRRRAPPLGGLDISTPEGLEAYHQWLTTGTIPGEGADFVSDQATVQTYDYTSGSTFGIEAGPFGMSSDTTGMHGYETVVTHGDGSQQQIFTQQWADAGTLTYTEDAASGGVTGSPARTRTPSRR